MAALQLNGNGIEQKAQDEQSSNLENISHYLIGIYLAIILALCCLAGAISLVLILGLTWPVLLAMAPLGAIFFVATVVGFNRAGHIPSLKQGLHYLMTGINLGANATYTTSGILKLVLVVGLGLATAPVSLPLAICMGLSAVIGFAFGIWERKQKYAENAKLKKILETKQKNRDLLQANVELEENRLLAKLKPDNRAIFEQALKAWEEKTATIKVEEIKSPLTTEPSAKFEKFKAVMDVTTDRFNDLKNYSRNIKMMTSLLPSILLIFFGFSTLNPVLVIAGVALGISFATMNYYRDKWEDEVFTQNSDYNKEIAAVELESALLNEKQVMLEQLSKVNTGEIIEFPERSEAEQAVFSKRFYNPLQKANYEAPTMFGLATFTAVETLLYAGLALAAVIAGIYFSPVTGGASLWVGVGIATYFVFMSAGNLVRRGYKEVKQNAKKDELVAEHEYLKEELDKLKHIKPALEPEQIEIHNYRTSLGSSNYTTYKAASGVKKASKTYTLLNDIVSHGHPIVIGIGIGVLTLNPVFLMFGIIAGGALAYASYKAEQVRIQRDKDLDDLKLMNQAMKTELKRLKAAKQRIEIVTHAQVEIAKKVAKQPCREHEPQEDYGNTAVVAITKTHGDKQAIDFESSEARIAIMDNQPKTTREQLPKPRSCMQPKIPLSRTVEKQGSLADNQQNFWQQTKQCVVKKPFTSQQQTTPAFFKPQMRVVQAMDLAKPCQLETRDLSQENAANYSAAPAA